MRALQAKNGFAAITAIVFWVGVAAIWKVSLWAVDEITPAENLMHYDRIEVVDAPVGGPVSFISYSERRKPLFVQWHDTVYCTMPDGSTRKVGTQLYPVDGPGFEQSKEMGPGEVWTWDVRPIPRRAVMCYLAGAADVGTMNGVRKIVRYRSDIWRPGQ